MSRRVAALLVAAALVAGCGGGGDDDDEAVREDLLTPDFAPDTSVAGPGGSDSSTTAAAPGATAPRGGATDGGGATGGAAPGGTGAGDGAVPPAQVAAPVVPGATTAAIADPEGDLTPSPLDPPPPWADLVGATMIRRADGFELRIRLGGGSAPTTTDEDHTMNIASYYDVDGDGGIDYEVWANLASGGWGGSHFDNRAGAARFADESGVTFEVAGADVVARFPLGHLGDAERFRWGLASEWGRYELIGTDAMARDDAPDDDAAARFPG